MLCVVLRLIQGFISFLYNCHRLCLVYNLVLLPPRQQQQQQQQRGRDGAAAAPQVLEYGPLAEQLGAAFTKWKESKQCAERLVYMFEHRWVQMVMCGAMGS
jgi:hypothetical protein